MGCCSGRCPLVSLCACQLVTAPEHQVFDFLGYQWAPTLATFAHIVMVILGLFGTVQHRPRCIVVDSELLTFNLSRHRSWWNKHGPGCQREDLAASLRSSDGQALVPGVVCTLEPSYVEALHSALQILLALVGFVSACSVVGVLTEEEDGCLTTLQVKGQCHPRASHVASTPVTGPASAGPELEQVHESHTGL